MEVLVGVFDEAVQIRTVTAFVALEEHLILDRIDECSGLRLIGFTVSTVITRKAPEVLGFALEVPQLRAKHIDIL